MALIRVAALFFLALVTACADTAIRADDVMGEWKKQGDSLPPINLLLERDGTNLLARLHLSGVELNGIARLEENKLLLEFPNRDHMVGEFTSTSTLRLRLDRLSGDFYLRKVTDRSNQTPIRHF